MLAFSTRNMKEIARDPLTFAFGMLLPILLLAMIHALTRVIGAANPAFAMANFAPGMAVFSLTFVMLFSSMLISGDRTGAFLMRLFSSPLRAADYILGYSLPVAAMGLMQARGVPDRGGALRPCAPRDAAGAGGAFARGASDDRAGANPRHADDRQTKWRRLPNPDQRRHADVGHLV
jgi:hypothetical protein